MTHIVGAGGLSYLRHFDALRTTIDMWLTPKGFNKNIFCHELDQTLLKTEAYKSKDPDSKFAEIFQEFLHKHAPLKSKLEVTMLLSWIKNLLKLLGLNLD